MELTGLIPALLITSGALSVGAVTFAIRANRLQRIYDKARTKDKPDALDTRLTYSTRELDHHSRVFLPIHDQIQEYLHLETHNPQSAFFNINAKKSAIIVEVISTELSRTSPANPSQNTSQQSKHTPLLYTPEVDASEEDIIILRNSVSIGTKIC